MLVRRLVFGALSFALAAALLGCSNQQAPAPEDGGGESIGETTPPGGDIQGQEATTGAGGISGAVGEASRVGEWTVLVRSVEAENGDERQERGTVEPQRGDTALLEVEVDLSHQSDGSLSVRREDWVLEDGEGGRFVPLEDEDPEKQGEREISRAETEDVTVRFRVPSAEGAYILRFEPLEGGPGVLRVAIP